MKSSGTTKLPSRHTPGAGRFNGFPREAFEFFAQLARNNQRDWFHAHKDVYERACREPMEQLVAELGANPATTKISRINRDVRFSRDKSPYRTYIAAGVGGNYISLSTAGVYVGTGLYKPEPPALERFRSAIDVRRQDLCARAMAIDAEGAAAYQACGEGHQTVR